MTLMSTPYFDLACNGKLANLRQPDCLAVSEGGFDQDEVIKAALVRGWTESGKGHKCPGCSYVAASDTLPERQTRGRGTRVPRLDSGPVTAPTDSGFPQ